MHRLQIAAIVALLLPSMAIAQMHSGSGSSSGTTSSHSFVPLPRGSTIHFGGGHRLSDHRVARQRAFSRRPLLSPFGLSTPFPYLYDYPFGAAYQDLDEEEQPAASSAAAQPEYDPTVDALSRRIDRLTSEIAAMREQQFRPAQPAPAVAAPAPALEQQPTTILVFKDKHDEQIQNYAIVSQMLWVLDSPALKKIPLDQLDIPDTTTVNNQRGVRFSVPPEDLK